MYCIYISFIHYVKLKYIPLLFHIESFCSVNHWKVFHEQNNTWIFSGLSVFLICVSGLPSVIVGRMLLILFDLWLKVKKHFFGLWTFYIVHLLLSINMQQVQDVESKTLLTFLCNVCFLSLTQFGFKNRTHPRFAYSSCWSVCGLGYNEQK